MFPRSYNPNPVVLFWPIFAGMTADKYELVIGLEVHAQLLTESKLFCADSSSFGAEPNTQVSPISLAHPGTLPAMNAGAIALAVKLGLALNCSIEKFNYFARKNYFYPDLPKGYQVSQHTAPICKGGWITVGERKIKLNRIHLEEDAGKSIHDADPLFTCIDLNRAGVPLLEIVSEPDLHSSEEAFIFLTELRKIVRWLDVCDGNMEEGSMRCDANISIRLKGDKQLGKRVEIKNLNSIRNVKKAIEIEFSRLKALEENGERILQETRGFDAGLNSTYSMRSKEEADDYRYFPEPDLPPFIVSDEYVADVREQMPLLPAELALKYINDFSLSAYDAAQVCNDKQDAHFFESVIAHCSHHKAVANWMAGPIRSFCNEKGIGMGEFPLKAASLAELINYTESGHVSFSNASTKILQGMLADEKARPSDLASRLGLQRESGDEKLRLWIDEVLAAMPDKIEEYKKGKKGLIGLFAGEVKKLSKGAADMQQVNSLLNEKLNN